MKALLSMSVAGSEALVPINTGTPRPRETGDTLLELSLEIQLRLGIAAEPKLKKQLMAIVMVTAKVKTCDIFGLISSY